MGVSDFFKGYGNNRYLPELTHSFPTRRYSDLIVHLGLARLPDAPGGTKGISLFVVPKFLPGPAGSLGARNGVKCGSLEHKMGIHGNATRSEEHTSELQSLMRISYAVFCLKKQNL